jgi:sulfide dehydrogenase [flavocytochrome c] flavoprotein chain
MQLNRRLFIGSAFATGAMLSAPTVFGQAKPKVVVIGGGAGGATIARYLAKDSDGALDVTLVEANPIYTTCFFSNLYIGGFRDFESLQHGYDKVAAGGVTVINDMATGVDRAARTVTLAGGRCWPMTGWCCHRGSISRTAPFPAGRPKPMPRSCPTPTRPDRRPSF